MDIKEFIILKEGFFASRSYAKFLKFVKNIKLSFLLMMTQYLQKKLMQMVVIWVKKIWTF